MRCPECQTDLPDTAKFCLECGRKLELNCSKCGKAVPLASKFCLECGHDLRSPSATAPTKDLSFDEKLAKIQKYLPSGLTEKVLSQRDKIEGEKRQVTIMFVDMKGFTPLTERLGPEETFSLMDQVFEILIHKVHEYEGTVNELRGDGILALFGAPVALEDGPPRAIRASLSMHREMVKLSEKVKAESGIPPIQVRIGINTGPVVVGTLGNDLRVQFTAVGDTINMAARMEQLAEPGTTYITEDTFKLTEGFFRFEALGEKPVKGKDKPLKIYRVIAPSTRRTRFDVNAERGLTRLVGRERELEIMLDAFDRAKAGRGQAVSIVGDAGVGKSRLLYEFRKAVANEDVTFLEGKSLSYGRGVAYHPIIDMLKSNFGIREEDEDSEIREKVKRGLRILDTEESTTLPYILELLSVKDSGIDEIAMSPEARKDRVVEAVKKMVLKGSEMRPLILVFEDLHWMDSSSEDLSKYLLESIAGARVLLIFSYRHEFVHTWGAKSYHSQLNLNRLSNREALAMVSDILRAQSLDGAVQDLVLEKTEGIPFFIEEFVRSLRDLHIITGTDSHYFLATETQGVTIPSTIQDMIMARVDSLPDAAKELLQKGSVVEREFTHELISAVSGLPEGELLSHLSVLKDSELLYERGIYPDTSYVFKHALTREVVYDSILTERKKTLHEKIGNAIGELYKANLPQHSGVLAEHYFAAGNWEKAAEHARFACKRAFKSASYKEAIEHGKKRVLCIERLPDTDSNRQRLINARTVLSGLYMSVGRVTDARDVVESIREIALVLDHRKSMPRIYVALGACSFWADEDLETGIHYLGEAVKVSEEIKDYVSLWLARFYSACSLAFFCKFGESRLHLTKWYDSSRMVEDPIGMGFAKASMSVFVYGPQGMIDSAMECAKESLEIAEQSGDKYIGMAANVSHGESLYLKGSFAEAEDSLCAGLAFCELTQVVGWGAWASLWLGHNCVERQKFEEAYDYYSKGISSLRVNRLLPSWTTALDVFRSKAKVLRGHYVDPNVVVASHKENRLAFFAGSIANCIGEIFAGIDDQHTSEAQHWIEEAIAADERNGMRFHLGRDYASYAELFRRKGDTFKAKEQLGKAIEIYKECGADGWVTKTEEELAKLS